MQDGGLFEIKFHLGAIRANLLGHCTIPNLKCAHVYVVAKPSLDSTLSRLKCLLRSKLNNDRIPLHTIHASAGLYADVTKLLEH